MNISRQKVTLVDDFSPDDINKAQQEGEIIMLENIRLLSGRTGE